jgi:signal transduction histidine kinase
LSEALEASRRELRESRSRIQSAADTERRRIERDLHDGAQQRLVRLRIKLELARETVDRQGALDSEVLQTLGDDVVAIIDEIRSLARGVYPHLLDDGGPAEALRSVARHSAVRVTVVAQDLPRYAAEVEAAIYFCCLEALQNVSKHATGARNVAIALAPSPLRFEIRDDGPGFDVDGCRRGAGLDNMQDRMAAVGGKLEISSARGHGTTVEGRIPGCDPLPG